MVAHELSLDPELVERIARRTQQWGWALLKSAREGAPPDTSRRLTPDELGAQRRREVARREGTSLLAIAGSYWLVVDPMAARSPLGQAARLLHEQGDAFAFPLGVCAGEAEVGYWAAEEPSRQGARTDDVYRLIGLGWTAVTERGHGAPLGSILQSDVESASGAVQAIGRTRIPAAIAGRVVFHAERMVQEGPAHIEDLAGALAELLRRSNELADEARGDDFHWKRLMSGVLPVEPETVALSAVAMAAAAAHGVDTEVRELIGMRDVPPHAAAPLDVGSVIARNGG